MIFILYGPDTYRSRQKLKEIVEEYRKKAGPDFNLEKLDAEEGNLTTLKNIVQGGALFSSKKLVIVEGAFSSEKNFSNLLDTVRGAGGAKEVFLILWDRGLSAEGLKRLEEVRPLADKAQEFKFLTGRTLQVWVEEEAKKRGLKLYPVQLVHLASLGGDLWQTVNELDKMVLVQGAGLNGQVAREQNIFHLGDTFFVSPKTALGALLSLLYQGHDDFNLFSYLGNHGRTLLTVKTYLDKKMSVPAHHRLHPYVIKKASALARGLSQEKLRALPGKFFEEDFKVKVGLSQPKESLLRILLNY